jgi:hypothetical protein
VAFVVESEVNHFDHHGQKHTFSSGKAHETQKPVVIEVETTRENTVSPERENFFNKRGG